QRDRRASDFEISDGSHPAVASRLPAVDRVQQNFFPLELCMPIKVLPTNDPKVEAIIQEGVKILLGQPEPNLTKVARELSERHGIRCPYGTLCRRFLNISKAPSAAHADQQLLSPIAEQVLVDWITFLSDTGHPVSKFTILVKGKAITRRSGLQASRYSFWGAFWDNESGRG
ncbi:hypothetical protein C8J56DRAFT_1119639, partial [Mycena floridula]